MTAIHQQVLPRQMELVARSHVISAGGPTSCSKGRWGQQHSFRHAGKQCRHVHVEDALLIHPNAHILIRLPHHLALLIAAFGFCMSLAVADAGSTGKRQAESAKFKHARLPFSAMAATS
ncbi:hypothetical protein ACLOJK_005152 [Asimina triloba]